MPATSTGMDWTDQTVAILRLLWSEGHSTAEIGRRMDTTKNAIVGKAHRLKLPARPSPIRAVSPQRPKSTARIKPSVPALAALLPAVSPFVELPPVPVPTPEPPPVRPAPLAATRRPSTCQWPIGEPGRTGFRLCGDESVAGRPYCSAHCGRAYVRPRDGATAFAAS